MRTAATISTFTLVALVSAAGGFLIGHDDPARLQRFETTKPLSLQTSPQALGRLPQGAILYQYQTFGETTQYVVFVSLKERDILRPIDSRERIVAPVSAYAE